jgi:hypothetical protein
MNDTENACQESLKYLTNLCLRAARINLLLIVDLKQCEKLGQLSFFFHSGVPRLTWAAFSKNHRKLIQIL